VFSAHGVAKSVPEEAAGRHLFQLDATCPLVTKVHREAEIHYRKGREIVLIGHAGHPEVAGTMGQLPEGAITLIETEADARAFQPRSAKQLAYITQTTLSVDDTASIVAILVSRFPDMVAPHKEDICYATTNRQEAVKRIASSIDAMIVIGAPNSSNSQRLREVAERAGCRRALLVQRAPEIDWPVLSGIRRVGITAGASAPEVLVDEVIEAFAERYSINVQVVTAAEEAITFNLPRALRDAAE
jgi:4-hydroxy-3-methylbut-2-enyl diphosphate reductase